MDAFFVADDFTGGVDVLLQAARCGQPAAMFLSEEAFLSAGPEQMQTCTGVATTFRRQSPDQVEGPLGRLIDHASSFDPWLVQYKICSTADSAPTRGSIGPAFRDFRRRGANQVALLLAQPDLRRYTAFSHHFAYDRGIVYRLDRQPTMSRHPSTPMTESDLRRHFALQIGAEVGAITLEDLADPQATRHAWSRELADERRLVLLDGVRRSDLVQHGSILAEQDRVYLIGSGGGTLAVGYGRGWDEQGGERGVTPPAGGPVLVVAGSCSELTAAQIAQVDGRAGWSVLHWDPAEGVAAIPLQQVHDLLVAGSHVVVHTGGASGRGADSRTADGRLVADVVPQGLAAVAQRALPHIARLVVAGGDTSGDVLTLLGADRLTTLAVLDQHTCICRVTGLSDGDPEVVLKGGQIGSVDFFIKVADGEG